MSHQYKKSFRNCVLVDVDSLVRLASETKLDLTNLAITAQCSDAVTRQYTTFDELRQYRNLKGEEIIRVSITIGLSYRTDTCSLTLRGSKMFDNIDCEATSENEDSLRECRFAFESFIERQSPWWAVIGNVNYTGLKAWLSIAALTLLLIWRYGDWTLLFLVMLIPAIIGWSMVALVPLVFPTCSFLIGAGESRNRRAELWRVVVIVGFIISFAASIAATELYKI